MKRLLLLGAGHAHLEVLRRVAAPASVAAEVVLVTPSPRQLYSGMVPGWVAGHYRLQDCAIALAPLAARAGARSIAACATGIDARARQVRLSDGRTLDYDLLSIDTGPVMNRDAIPGARAHGVFVRPIEDFAVRWDALREQAARARLDVVVVGGGAAGVELAMAIQHRLRARASVALVTGGGPVLASHPRSVQARAARALARRGIEVLDAACAGIEAAQVHLDDASARPCDAAVLALGAAAPGWLRGSGLALDERGFVATGPTLQSTSHPEVFAAGDVATRLDQPHAKSGVHAVRAGPPLALNLRRAVDGGRLLAHTPRRRALSLLSCGERQAIASWGPLALEGRWVWRWKDRIDRAFVERYAGQRPTS